MVQVRTEDFLHNLLWHHLSPPLGKTRPTNTWTPALTVWLWCSWQRLYSLACPPACCAPAVIAWLEGRLQKKVSDASHPVEPTHLIGSLATLHILSPIGPALVKVAAVHAEGAPHTPPGACQQASLALCAA